MMAHHKKHRTRWQSRNCCCKYWKLNGIKGSETARTKQEKLSKLNEEDENPSFEEIEKEPYIDPYCTCPSCR